MAIDSFSQDELDIIDSVVGHLYASNHDYSCEFNILSANFLSVKELGEIELKKLLEKSGVCVVDSKFGKYVFKLSELGIKLGSGEVLFSDYLINENKKIDDEKNEKKETKKTSKNANKIGVTAIAIVVAIAVYENYKSPKTQKFQEQNNRLFHPIMPLEKIFDTTNIQSHSKQHNQDTVSIFDSLILESDSTNQK